MQKNPTTVLGTKPIGKLLLKLSLPAAFGMIIMALYNVVDTIFVGHGVGIKAIGGISIVFPIQMILMGIAIGLGIGGASVISRALGAKNQIRAEKTLGNMIFLLIVLSTLVVIPGYIHLNKILVFFGATDELLEYASDYMKILLPGLPFMLFVMMLNNVIRAEGRAKIAMFSMLSGALLNTMFDPIFIFIFKMGIKGAALATVLSNFIVLVFLWFYLLTNRNTVKFSFRHIRFYKNITSEILSLGFPTLIRNISRSLLTIVVNKTLYYYGTYLDIAVYGLMHRILAMLMMPMFGILQGMQPILGYNFGAKKFDRVKMVIRISALTVSIISILGFILIEVFAPYLLGIFSSSPILKEHGAYILRITSLCLPVLGIQFLVSGVFQSVGKAFPSFILAISRQFLIFLPMALILPIFWGTFGLWISFPISDFIGFLINIYVFSRYFNLKKSTLQFVR